MSEIDELRDIVKRAEAARRSGVPLSGKASAIVRQAKAILLEHEHGEGAVEARKCRASGALRVLYRPGTQADASEGWQVICADHGFVLDNETRQLGSLAMSDPYWCDECAEKVKGQGGR